MHARQHTILIYDQCTRVIQHKTSRTPEPAKKLKAVRLFKTNIPDSSQKKKKSSVISKHQEVAFHIVERSLGTEDITRKLIRCSSSEFNGNIMISCNCQLAWVVYTILYILVSVISNLSPTKVYKGFQGYLFFPQHIYSSIPPFWT